MSNEISEIKEDVEDVVEESAKRQKVEHEQNEDIDAQLSAIEKQIKTEQYARDVIDKHINTLEDKRVELLRQKQKLYFRILCTSDKTTADAHAMGLFSTVEKAMEQIPASGNSYEKKSGITWYYSLKPLDSSTKNIEFDILDKPVYEFPYK
jgi:hypothetical protein